MSLPVPPGARRGRDEHEDALVLSPAPGFVEPQVADEFPGLRLDWLTVAGRRRSSPPALVHRLRALSTRYRGASVVAMRTHPIPQAFRVFFRHIGLDPDVKRIPSEQAAVTRLLHGEFRSSGLIADACLVALIETGVPVWALDADVVDVGGLGIRTATGADLEAAGARELRISPGSLTVADHTRVHAPLFGDPAPGRGVGGHTRRVALYAVGVDGVPAIHVEEALWTCLEALR
jgi:DNA/RNA-binding domain of Phe-tRNA-synthetase-like protein